MSATVAPVTDDIYTALRSFIQGVVGSDIEVIKGLGNRVAMPPGPFIAMTALSQIRLNTNVDTWDEADPNPGVISAEQCVQINIQVDAYGPSSSNWATMLSTLFRDDYACQALGPNCQPLYCEDPRLMPLVAGESQYIERWLITCALQFNPTTQTPMQFVDALTVGLIDVDQAFPP